MAEHGAVSVVSVDATVLEGELLPPDGTPRPPQLPDLVREVLAAVPVDTSRGPFTLDVDYLDAFVRASAANTRRALKADAAVFGDWCRRHRCAGLPAATATIVAFLKAQAAAGKAPATLSRYLSSIGTLHGFAGHVDPTRSKTVRLELKVIRLERGVRQRQALPLRFKGAVADVVGDASVGVCIDRLMQGCPADPGGLRDRALLSLAYDTGLRRAEIVRVEVGHLERVASGAGRLYVPRTKTDREGEGSYAYLSARSIRAIDAWLKASGIAQGPLFRRVYRAKVKARSARGAIRLSGRAYYDPRRERPQPARAAGEVWTIGDAALTPQSVTLIYKAAIRRAHTRGLLGAMRDDEVARWLAGVSAHSTRVGITQDLVGAGKELGAIMQALRWKSPSQPARYAQALAADTNAAAQVVGEF